MSTFKYIPEDSELHTRRRENLKRHIRDRSFPVTNSCVLDRRRKLKQHERNDSKHSPNLNCSLLLCVVPEILSSHTLQGITVLFCSLVTSHQCFLHFLWIRIEDEEAPQLHTMCLLPDQPHSKRTIHFTFLLWHQYLCFSAINKLINMDQMLRHFIQFQSPT
jgi:hypothetical protein